MNTKIAIASKTACRCLLILVSWISAGAQTVEHLGSFWAFGDVQFLPGGYVFTEDEGENHYYLLENSKFKPFEGKIPSLIKDWQSFNWTIDNIDQIDMSERLGGDLRALLPRRAKVKKYFEIETPGEKADVAFICYTRHLQIPGSNTQDIFLLAAINPNPFDTRSQHRKLWVRKLASESNYGDFQHQTLSDGSDFLLLYSAGIGGDAVEHQLDVYRIRGLEEKRNSSPKSTHKH